MWVWVPSIRLELNIAPDNLIRHFKCHLIYFVPFEMFICIVSWSTSFLFSRPLGELQILWDNFLSKTLSNMAISLSIEASFLSTELEHDLNRLPHFFENLFQTINFSQFLSSYLIASWVILYYQGSNNWPC